MKNGALVSVASGELDLKIHLRNGEAALVGSVEQELLLMHDELLVCVPGVVYLMMHNGYGSVAFAGSSLRMNDGTGLVAVAAASLRVSRRAGLAAFDGASPPSSDGLVAPDGAFLWRSDELELGASGEASLQKNNVVGVLWPGDFDKCPPKIDLVGWGELLAVVTAGVVMELNVIDVGGDDYEPVVPDSS